MAVVEAERPSGVAGAPAVSAAPAASRSPIELFAIAVALLIPVAYATSLEGPAWSPRAAILLLVVAVGGPVLFSQARGPRPLPARAALAFLMVGFVSAMASGNRTTAVFGLYNQGTGLIFMASLAGIWAIGREVRPEARPVVEVALLIGVLVNVGVALVATVVDLTTFSTALSQAGRSSALAGNPVFLGALTVLGLALAVGRFAVSPARWAIPVVAIGAAAQLSGTRTALVVMVVILVWAARRHGLALGSVLAVLVVLGLALGSALLPSGRIDATGRANIGQLSGRTEVWLSTRHSILQRPLLGIGPGQFRTATSGYRTIAEARSEGPDTLFADAHNLFVEYAVTTGLLGLVALLVWLVAATWPGRGCLLAGALGLLAFGLLEPQSAATTPLAFLALGASASYGIGHARRERHAARQIVERTSVAVAVVVAAVFLFGNFDLSQALRDLRLTPARQANGILPAWPITASTVARVWLYNGIVSKDQADFRQSRVWRLIALKRDSTDPALWNDLAELDEGKLLASDATAEYLSALRFNPTSTRAMDGLARIAGARCDLAQQRYWTARSRAVIPAAPVLPIGAQRLRPPAPACAGKAGP